MAILEATKTIAPSLWGWIADRTGARLSMVRLASLSALLVFPGIFAGDRFWGIALVMTLFGFFWHASLPQIEVITFNHLGPRAHLYATIQLWGLIGFIIAVLALGAAAERTGTHLVPESVLVLYAGIWLSSLVIPDPERPPPKQSSGSLSSLVRQGAFYVFYSLYLTEVGYSSTAVGALWALGRGFGDIGILAHAPPAGAFRHPQGAAGQPEPGRITLASDQRLRCNPVLQLIAQTLHAATFGAFHAAAIHLVHHHFSGRTQGSGRALYNGLSFGFGVAVGGLLSGVLWSKVSAGLTFALSAPVAGLGWLVVWG